MNLIPSSISNQTLEAYLVKISARSRIIYWIIIGTVVALIASLPYIFVDVSVQARGYFQSDIEKQVVYTPFQGKVRYTSVRNGERVEKGDTLLVIDYETISAQTVAFRQKIAENDASLSDLEILTKIDSSDLDYISSLLTSTRYRAEAENVRNQHIIQYQKCKKKKAEHERNQLLYEQDIIPEADFENSLYLLTSENDNLNQILLYQKSLWQSDLAARRNERVSLLAGLEQCMESITNRILVAPASGEVIQTADIQKGSIVGQGQMVAEISPYGELIATCFVKPSDIGLVQENQKVKIQVEAFNYNEWGMLQGEIVDISDDMIVEDGSNVFFRIKCRPDRTYLTLRNGHKAFIKKGMSVNTRIIVTQRSLFNLLFDKADKWFNPYTYKPE